MRSLSVHPNNYKKNFLFFFFFFDLVWENEWKEHKFWRENKKVTKIDDVNKIFTSKEEPYGTKNSLKYFTGYNDNDVIRPLCMKLPQMIGHVRNFHGNRTMSFKISDKQLLKKYNHGKELKNF